jgi:hypothetical protein
MEETDMCYPTPSLLAVQQAIPNGCPAKALKPSQKQTIGVQALAGEQSISGLAADFQVSRKFVYQQADTARMALVDAFGPEEATPEQVLFHLPVTKSWLRQLTLGLVLVCRSSLRGVVELLRDVFDYSTSLTTVHRTLHDAVAKARPFNTGQDLANVRIGALDELFQARQPLLVAADADSTYCFLLSPEERRDADTWALRLLELQDRGLAPEATIADAAVALRAGQALAMPQVPCYGDTFHALYAVTPLVSYLENRAYEAIAKADRLQQQQAHKQRQGQTTRAVGQALRFAREAESHAVALADAVALLVRWLQLDVLAVNSLPYADRRALYDFLVAELKAREPLCAKRIGEVCRLLVHQRDDLLAFAAQLDRNLITLADKFQAPLGLVRQLFDVQGMDSRHARRWPKEAALRDQLRSRFWPLSRAVRALRRRTVRASSVIENFNSRLRNYVFLRRHLGADYLTLLQFFLNHRRFLRSAHPERVGKSPAELLTGQPHAHWLELLGFQLFSRN